MTRVHDGGPDLPGKQAVLTANREEPARLETAQASTPPDPHVAVRVFENRVNDIAGSRSEALGGAKHLKPAIGADKTELSEIGRGPQPPVTIELRIGNPSERHVRQRERRKATPVPSIQPRAIAQPERAVRCRQNRRHLRAVSRRKHHGRQPAGDEPEQALGRADPQRSAPIVVETSDVGTR